MGEIKRTKRTKEVIDKAIAASRAFRHEFVMPEHVLLALVYEEEFASAIENFYPADWLEEQLRDYLGMIETVPPERVYEPEASEQLTAVLNVAVSTVEWSSAEAVDIPHLVKGILELEESWAAWLMRGCLGVKEADFLNELIRLCKTEDLSDTKPEETEAVGEREAWRRLVTCMNELYADQNPLIGREAELQRTIQVLCRRNKNNPLHVGEPGVGKTALVWGLARMIEEGRVPERLKGSRIYQGDMGGRPPRETGGAGFRQGGLMMPKGSGGGVEMNDEQ